MSRLFPRFSRSSFVRVNGCSGASPHRCPFRIHASLRLLDLVGFGVLFADPAAIAQVFFRLGRISYAGIGRSAAERETFARGVVLKLPALSFEHAWGRGTLPINDDPGRVLPSARN